MATQAKIDIKSAGGTTLLSTSINEGAKGYYSLMQHDYIVLPFKLRTPIDFKIGSYVDLRGVFDDALGGKLAKIYYVTELQNPSYNTSTGAYEYQLRLNAYYWLWNNFIFKYTPESTAGEASWSLTAPLDVQLGVFLRNLSELGFTYNGVPYEYSIDSTVENKAVAMTYDNTRLLDALFSMGGENAWDCDVWVTENVIHFGRCEHGDAVKIEIGVEASDMTRNESRGTFATRIYAFGSTRNIPENYRETSNPDLTVNGIVQKRLMLPADTPYIDAYPDMQPFEVVECVMVNEAIYPRRTGTLSDVKTVDRAIEDGEGNQTGTFKAYQYKDTGLTFDEEYILEGKELRIVFRSGKLNGLDFGVIFNPNNSDPAEQLWEIEANEDYGRRLPDEVMKPENGDKYILYGFNIKLVSDQYTPEAEQELKEWAQGQADRMKIDDGTYTVPLRASYVREDMISRTYDVGQKVNLVNPFFFGTEGRISRVIGWEMCLDIPYDNPIYTIGESAQYSRIGEIEDKVESLTYKGQTYTGTGGSGVYVIRTNDSTPASDTNVFSALRSLAVFLRKDREDQTNFLLKLLGGIITNNIESEGFTTGALGAGFTLKIDENGRSYLEVDYALFRRSATFIELLIQSLRHVGGQIMLTPASMHCIRVEEQADSYRCYFESTDGDRTIANEFVVGDQARSQTFNIKEGVHENVKNTYYWRLVTAVGDDYIDLSKTDCDAGSGVPSEGDDIVQLGNRTDAERQAAIILSSYGNDAPYFKLYRGINSYDLTGKEFVSFSRSEVMVIADSIRLSTGETVKDYIDGKLGSLQIGGRNLILNSKLDNKDGWSTNYTGSIVEFGGYKCLKIEGAYHGLYTSPDRNSGNVPIEGVITNSIDVYATEECDIHFGCQDLPNTVHITELNKWIRIHNTQTMDGETHAYYVYGGEKTIYCKNVKCEKGSVATDWTPAPEDLENSIVKVSEKVDSNFEVTQGLIKSEINSVKVMGTGSENIVKEGNYGITDSTAAPGIVELYTTLVKGNTYTAVISGEVADGYAFELCDSGMWEIQGYFENVGGRIHLLRFTYEPNLSTTNHSSLYLKVSPNYSYYFDLDWVCIYEGNVIPPYVFIPAPQEQESGSLDIGVRNLLLNSKLDNLDGWQINFGAEIVVFDGYTCLKVKGNAYGIYTSPSNNARLIPTDGTITNSIDIYVTEVCEIYLGREGISTNRLKVTEANKWVRVHNTQVLDGKKGAYTIYTIGSTATAYFKDAKCETGTVPTGWTPAPEDLKGFNGQNLVVRGRYNITDNANYQIRGVYLSKDLTAGKTYTAVLSGDVGGSQQFGLWDSTSLQQQGLFTKKSGRIYTLTFVYKKRSDSNANTLVLYNYPKETCAANPADVDWLCIYEGAVDAPDVFVPAPEDDAELVAWGGHYGADKNDIYLNDIQAETETGRALHLHKLDVNRMKITMVGKYDVYATTGDAKTQFVTALNGITGDNLAIVTSRDAITIDTNIQAALNDFGADAPELTQSRTSFVLVGKKGIGAGNGVMKTSSTNAVSVTVRIIEGVCMDFFGNGNFVTWKEETKTWIKETDKKINLHAESITSMGNRVSRAESDISMNAKEIELRVKDEDLDGNEVVSRINQTSTTVTIEASKINLVGKVTIGMFDKTIMDGDFIKTSLIKADELEVSKLKSATGTFKKLTCVDDEGNPAGDILFEDGKITFYTCDLQHQGTLSSDGNRGLRFLMASAIVRGALSVHGKFTVVVKGTYAYYYKEAYGPTAPGYVRVNLQSSQASDGTTYYTIPLNSVATGLEGITYNTVIISRSTTTVYRYVLGTTYSGCGVDVINANDKPTAVNNYLYAMGYAIELNGGAAYRFIYIDYTLWIADTSAANAVGRGWLCEGFYDNGK